MSDKLMPKYEKKSRRRLSQDEISRIIDMKNAGMANCDIERSLGRAHETVRRAVNRYWRGKPMMSTDDIQDVRGYAREQAVYDTTLNVEPSQECSMPGSMEQVSATVLGRHGKYQIDIHDGSAEITFSNKSAGMIFVDANDIDVLISELTWLRCAYMQPKNS